MTLAVVYSRAQLGVKAPLVTVEVQLSNGLPSLSIVGLPETAVRESKDRVRCALLHSGFEFPARRITINLAPADLPKEGGRFDLPIALGVLIATGQLQCEDIDLYEFIGELGLDGSIRPVRGVLPASLQASKADRIMICPDACAAEAGLIHPKTVYVATHLLKLCAHLSGKGTLSCATPATPPHAANIEQDMNRVRGQYQARRALEIAAAGGHNLLFIGPPGTGKTLLASCLPGILPPLTQTEAIDTAAILSISNQEFISTLWQQRPFRAPHHTASAVALVGGGKNALPGEISLAHNGVLFLDELPEYQRSVLDVLREPLETGEIIISRAARQSEYPARFQLIAAMNPCKCGHYGNPNGQCRCTSEQVQNYRNRISGPLLDRIDLHVEVPAMSFDELDGPKGECSEDIRQRVIMAREQQLERIDTTNAQMHIDHIEQHCTLLPDDRELLKTVLSRFNISARAYHRILKVARTIADLDRASTINRQHLTEAISLRCMDRTHQ
ncbi:MAG: YifB family Mg chelatase-like AAA ATPase [Gammaproteobacteria bacterium]